MATEQYARVVEQTIGYRFQLKQDLLLRALTAAGAVKEAWDGNRKLAQFGTVLTEFLLTQIAFEADAAREDTCTFRCTLSSTKQRADVARRTGIDKCIKYSERGGAGSSGVLSKAVNAIIAAVYLDCGGNDVIVLGVMRRLGVFLQPDQTIDPTLLSNREETSCAEIATFAKTLLCPRIDGASTSALSSQGQLPIVSIYPLPDEAGSATQAEHMVDVPVLTTSRHEMSPSLFNVTAHEKVNLDYFLDHSFSYGARSTDIREEVQEDQGDQEEPTDDVDHYQQNSHRRIAKRKISVISRAWRKKKSLRGDKSQSQDDVLAAYLFEETKRCESHGYPPPKESFFTPAIRETIENSCEAKAGTIAKILVYIAGPHSIAALQGVLKRSRDHENVPTLHWRMRLSKEERSNLIRTLDQNIMHLQLLRRHHILELYKECGGLESRPDGGFVLMTQCSFVTTRNRPGNPTFSAEAEVTTKMMEEIFPNVQPDSGEYRNKYRNATALRKLGQRLHALETIFGGRGVLGLMLSDGLTGQLGVGITDSMILSLSDAVFSELVSLLDKSQGYILREFSAAICTIVDAVVQGSLQQHEPFKLEQIQPSDILQHPKGSRGLLSLICE